MSRWEAFRERNGIGDKWQDMSGKLEQSEAVVRELAGMATRPSGILILQGKPGTGKTFASMRVLEWYTRDRSDALFWTGAGLKGAWLEGIRGEGLFELTKRCKEYKLLVIDDFGQGEPSPGFMEWLFEVLNARLGWSDRGTILSTNLEPSALMRLCGEALADRLRVEKWLKFEGASRRKR